MCEENQLSTQSGLNEPLSLALTEAEQDEEQGVEEQLPDGRPDVEVLVLAGTDLPGWPEALDVKLL